MFKFHRVMIVAAMGMLLPIFSLSGRAETLRFAWPDGASAKVNARSVGVRVTEGTKSTWDMSCDFTMHIQRTGDRIVVARNGFSGWKGTLPPSFGGGAERFIDMIPTFILSRDGAMIGIEGFDTVRKLMISSVEQSGGIPPLGRNAFETLSSNAALEAMAKDHWSTLIHLWEDVELDPTMIYELRNVTAVPQLGGGEIEITGTVKFVKETPCASGGVERRCVHLQAETGADKAKVSKALDLLARQAGTGADRPTITAWDQRFKVDVVLDKATMLPQQLTIVRLNGINVKMKGQDHIGTEEINKTYTFNWVIPAAEQKK